ncbi:MAG: nitrite reductase, copper-containing [Bacteroidetes bacterium]|nr:MAG: nitrite reductase, copper-containing [Bacteroidota bacterium]
MKKSISILALSSIVLLTACSINGTEEEKKPVDPTQIMIHGRITAELTDAPNVPPPVGDRRAKVVEVSLEILEKEGELADGVKYVYWTFGGQVPGKFIRTRVGDEVKVTLKNNPNNKLAHNIDMHAVTGTGGGAKSSLVAPGHEVTFEFKTLHPGLYIYHCATAPVGMHIANGMYGLILVEPEGGLPEVDREYYVMQSEFYTKGKNGQPGLQPFSMEKAIAENPDYVVFNGKVGALVGDNALTANVGETVRIFMGNIGPNLISSFHIIGEHFDNVNVEAGSLVNHDVQTTLIPAGGAAMVELKVEVPGTFLLVDHSIFRAFNKGALGMLKVQGKEDEKLFKGKIEEGVYHPEGGAIQVTNPAPKASIAASKDDRITLGKQVYLKTCIACHQQNGQGIPSAFPPLSGSDFLNADVNRAIDVVLNGKTGPFTVNGKSFNGVMPAQVLTNEEVANVLTYVYNNWGNNKSEITPSMVAEVKNQ